MGKEVRGDALNFHNEEFHDLKSQPIIFRVSTLRTVKCAAIVTLGEKRNPCRVLGRNVRRLLGRPGRRRADSIRFDLYKTVWNGVD